MNSLINAVILAVLLALSFENAAAQGVPSPYTPRLQTVMTGLSRPILVRGVPDNSGRLFVVQQGGIIKVLQPGASVPTDFMNISLKITVPTSVGDERGLLGMTFHPQYATNGKFYVDYTRVGDGTTVIAEYTRSTTDPNQGNAGSERILLTIPQPFSNHNGGMVEFGPDGFLYIGMGDGGSANDPGNRAQNMSILLGKLLRIDVNVPQGNTQPYLIPATNPFIGPGTTRCETGSTTAGTRCQEIWTFGMRNPWRYSFDRGNGALWVADVGQGSREEVDVITSGGGNYGWRVMEGSQCTGLDPCTPTNYIAPLFDYLHSGGRCSITGGYVYRGLLGSLPQGAYTYGDYCTGELLMWLNGASNISLIDTPRSVTSFGEDNNGEVYVCYPNGLNNQGQIDRFRRGRARADFDGDLKTDIGIYRPSEGNWYIQNSSNATNRVQKFGVAEDIPVPDDYDGDNISDIAVYRPSTGVFWSFRSSDATVVVRSTFGQATDIPIAADFDGDAKADLALYRGTTGTWFIFSSRNPDEPAASTQFGINGDIPTVGDYDGDGQADISVFRPSTGDWWWIRSSSPNSGYGFVHWGQNGDLPVKGDFDGDFKTDQAVYRPSTGVWYVLQSSNLSAAILQWGVSTDIPAVGDYDGDGKEDFAVFRGSTGVWYIFRSSSGTAGYGFWGVTGDLPTAFYEAP